MEFVDGIDTESCSYKYYNSLNHFRYQNSVSLIFILLLTDLFSFIGSNSAPKQLVAKSTIVRSKFHLLDWQITNLNINPVVGFHRFQNIKISWTFSSWDKYHGWQSIDEEQLHCIWRFMMKLIKLRKLMKKLLRIKKNLNKFKKS